MSRSANYFVIKLIKIKKIYYLRKEKNFLVILFQIINLVEIFLSVPIYN